MVDLQTVLTATASMVLGAGLVLAVCANATAAEGTTLALLRPQPISPFTPLTRISSCGHLHYGECRHCCVSECGADTSCLRSCRAGCHY
jgi:hypothetical protein